MQIIYEGINVEQSSRPRNLITGSYTYVNDNVCDNFFPGYIS